MTSHPAPDITAARTATPKPTAARVRYNAERFPDKVALIEGRRRMTYATLDACVDACADALERRGAGHGDRIGILARSSLDWIVFYLAIGRLGCTAVPVNWKLTDPEIAACIRLGDPRLLVVTPELQAVAAAEMPRERLFELTTACVEECLAARGSPRPDPVVADDQTQVILFTGGTTGAQKGVMLSHEALHLNTIQLVVDTEMHEDDVTILATPLHHAGALVIWLIPHLYLGATAVVLADYSATDLIETIARDRVTNGWTPPSMTRDLLDHPLARQRDLSCFQRWYVAGGPFPRRDREAMLALLPNVRIFYQYGLTEAGVMVTVLKHKDYERAPDSIGRAFLHCRIRILREDLGDAAVGEVGEIAVLTPSLMTGYFRQPDATAATMLQGWLRTGDMGSMDEHGYVRFHDRLKDMVKTGGFNVYSQEVEQVLLRHPAVREAAVIGVPSDRWGEEVVAVAVLRPDAHATPEEILSFARDHLARYKVPKRLQIVDLSELPINYSGKIVKRELRARFSRQ